LPNALWTSSEETLALQGELRKVKKDGGVVRERTLLALGNLFSGAPSGKQTDLWNAETALLVRWGLFKCPDRQAFLDFVLQATREPVTEPLFRKCLGITYGEADRQLGAYLADAASETIDVPLTVAPAGPLRSRDASSLEVARIIGGWGRLEGRPTGPITDDFEEECLGQADKLFERSLARNPNEPNFLAAFGLYELQVGDSGRARKALEAATHAGVVRPRAYLELARLRLVDAMPYIEGGIGDLNESDFNEIHDLLSTARSQMPSLPSTYTLLARLLEHGPSTPSHEDLRVLGDAVHLFPQNAALAYKAAALYGKSGYPGEGAAIVQWALGFAQSEHDRTLLSSFLAGAAR
jgi:tetratricopeptide (TPR) repeat protein